MSKTIIDGTSDYAKAIEELKIYKEFVNKKAIDKLIEKKRLAEKTLRNVQDLINSNVEIVHFKSAKQEFNKPIEDYFRKAK